MSHSTLQFFSDVISIDKAVLPDKSPVILAIMKIIFNVVNTTLLHVTSYFIAPYV